MKASAQKTRIPITALFLFDAFDVVMDFVIIPDRFACVHSLGIIALPFSVLFGKIEF